MKRIALAAALIAALASASVGARQGTPAPTGAISGTVTDASSGLPLAAATVTLMRGRDVVRSQPADRQGRFVFVELPPSAKYFVRAQFTGFSTEFAGASAAGDPGRSITVADRGWVKDVAIRLYHGGSVTGTVSDERHEPVIDAFVTLLQRVAVSGHFLWARRGMARTDDRGFYAFQNLPTAAYAACVPIVHSSVPADFENKSITVDVTAAGQVRQSVPEPTERRGDLHILLGRYPSAGTASGTNRVSYRPVCQPDLLAGAELEGTTVGVGETGVMDLELRPVRTFVVSGRIAGPPESYGGAVLRLLPAGAGYMTGSGSEVATTVPRADGTFTFPDVPRGAYRIDVRRSLGELIFSGGQNDWLLPAAPGLIFTRMLSVAVPQTSTEGSEGLMVRSWDKSDQPAYRGEAPIDVGGDLSDVVVPMQLPGRLVARLSWEDSDDTSQPLSVRVDPASGDPALALAFGAVSLSATDLKAGTFTLPNLPAGQYVVTLTDSAGTWSERSMIWRGQEWSDRPIDVGGGDVELAFTMTRKQAVVTGSVAGGDSSIANAVTVLAFPADRQRWTSFGLRPRTFAVGNASDTGHYRIATLPAGDFDLVAVAGAARGDWQTPAFLERASALAVRVSLRWGDQATANLSVVDLGGGR